MSFWSIYEQSSAGWRNDWTQDSRDWNVPLGNNFNHLILLADTPVTAPDQFTWFSRYRDRFCQQLHLMEPESFPRWGQFSTSASQILQVVSGQTEEPYLEQDLICSQCEVLAKVKVYTCSFTNRHDLQTLTSIWVVWGEIIKCYCTAPRQARCHCQGQNEVKDLKIPDTPWIWFE
jgi:hypothetical protein